MFTSTRQWKQIAMVLGLVGCLVPACGGSSGGDNGKDGGAQGGLDGSHIDSGKQTPVDGGTIDVRIPDAAQVPDVALGADTAQVPDVSITHDAGSTIDTPQSGEAGRVSDGPRPVDGGQSVDTERQTDARRDAGGIDGQGGGPAPDGSIDSRRAG